MSWFKLLRHDMRSGLLRWRYLLSVLIFSIPCFLFSRVVQFSQIEGSWVDYMLYLFQGKEPLSGLGSNERVELPILWLLVCVGCLFFNLDYLLKDLTTAGQQIILRSGNRKGWFLSKCLWNLCSCGLYFLMLSLTCMVFALASGCRLSLYNTKELSFSIFGFAITEELALPPSQAIIVGWLLPFLTVAALSMAQMTLCLFVKPVVSFIICFSQLVLSVYWNHVLALGNGAMTVRSGLVTERGISPMISGLVAMAVILVSVVAGTLRFQYTDILNLEE